MQKHQGSDRDVVVTGPACTPREGIVQGYRGHQGHLTALHTLDTVTDAGIPASRTEGAGSRRHNQVSAGMAAA